MAAGAFQLEIDGGLQAFRAPRPAMVLLSSAGTERNARIGDDLQLRDADIPILQLNPGGVLNWKYKGEAAVRASGLPYCVLRATGIISDAQAADEPETYTIEFAQGDQIQGKLSRSDVATIVSAALQRPTATNTCALGSCRVPVLCESAVLLLQAAAAVQCMLPH